MLRRLWEKILNCVIYSSVKTAKQRFKCGYVWGQREMSEDMKLLGHMLLFGMKKCMKDERFLWTTMNLGEGLLFGHRMKRLLPK